MGIEPRLRKIEAQIGAGGKLPAWAIEEVERESFARAWRINALKGINAAVTKMGGTPNEIKISPIETEVEKLAFAAEISGKYRSLKEYQERPRPLLDINKLRRIMQGETA